MEEMDIKELLKEEPFQPFRIHLSDSRSVEITHPEAVWFPPKPFRIFIQREDGWISSIRPMHIVSVEYFDNSKQ